MMASTNSTPRTKGTVTQVLGNVVDIEFPAGQSSRHL